MKTIKIYYEVKPYYYPKCKTLYFSEVDCKCDDETKLKEMKK